MASTGPHRWSDEDLLWPEEARAILKVSRAHVYKLAASGELPCVRVGGALRIVRSGLDSYLNGLLLTRSTPTTRPAQETPDEILRRVEGEG